MLDCITGGRLITGMVRGIGAEYYSLGANPAFSHARFQEAHDLVVRGVDPPGPVRVRGQVLSFRIRERVAAALSAAASADLGALDRQHRDHRMGGASVAQIRLSAGLQPDRSRWCAISTTIARCAQRMHGYTASSDQIGWSAPVYVADTDEQGARGGEAAYRDAVQQAAAPAVRDAVPARLSLGQVAEEHAQPQAHRQPARSTPSIP